MLVVVVVVLRLIYILQPAGLIIIAAHVARRHQVLVRSRDVGGPLACDLTRRCQTQAWRVLPTCGLILDCGLSQETDAGDVLRRRELLVAQVVTLDVAPLAIGGGLRRLAAVGLLLLLLTSLAQNQVLFARVIVVVACDVCA